MEFRHEWKHEIDWSDLLVLRQRLSAAAGPDPHAVNGRYWIRSLYFDDLTDRALREKLNGVSVREKFRLRYYNGDTSLIRLEKKRKRAGLCGKESALVAAGQAAALLSGDGSWMEEDPRPLVRELRRKMRGGLRPKTLVDYTREPFVFGPGNVRVTLDYRIRTGIGYGGFLDPCCVTIPAGDAPVILEVKWDAFLPQIIRDAVQLPGRHTSSFSKYAACRIYG